MIPIEGAYDLHVHSAPCIFPRLADDFGVAAAAQAAGLRAILLKSHHEPTVARAAIATEAVQASGARPFTVLGSVTLNHSVGGVIAAAAQSAIAEGARMVWMPTIDSAAHAAAFGPPNPPDSGQAASRSCAPIAILSEGRLTATAQDVLASCHASHVALATGHLGRDEILTLAAAAYEMGFRRLVITHPNFRVPGLDSDALTRLAELGAWFEFTYCTVSPMWRHATIEGTVAAIHTVGPERVILSSDCGQPHNPMPHEGLRLIAQMCLETGVAETEVYKMICDNPAELVLPA